VSQEKQKEVPMRSVLDDRQRDPVFTGDPSLTVVLDDEFVIRAATPAYARATGRTVEELRTSPVFEMFPDNPAAPEVASVSTLRGSLERVIRTRRRHEMSPLRYDIPAPGRPDTFVEKRWLLTNAPVTEGSKVVGVAIRAQDVTMLDSDLVAGLAEYRDLLEAGDLRSFAARDRLAGLDTFIAAVEGYGRLATEVAQMKDMLRSRPTIDQAKGIIMRDRRCTPDEAFQVLRQISRDTNVKLADVAAALVREAQGS